MMCFTRAIVHATSLPSDYIHILKRKHVERNNSLRHAFLDLEKKITAEELCFETKRSNGSFYTLLLFDCPREIALSDRHDCPNIVF